MPFFMYAKKRDFRCLRDSAGQIIWCPNYRFNDNNMSLKENIASGNIISSKIAPKLPTTLKTSAAPAAPPAMSPADHLQKALLGVHQKRNIAQDGYEGIIASLKQIIEELLQRNEFLLQDRDTLLRENQQLRKKNQSLGNVLEVKRRLGDSVNEQEEIFEVIMESASVTNGMSKIEESCDQDAEMEASGLMDQRQVQQNTNLILNRNQFAISSNPLSYNISQIDDNEISMSNIGRTEMVTRQQTPGLPRETIILQCRSNRIEGVLRAFYLSILQRLSTAQQLIRLLEQLRNDITVVIFQSYPSNDFWTDLLTNFVKIVHRGQFQTQTHVLDYLKTNRLVDTLLINCIRSRIEFLFQYRDSCEPPSVEEILRSLANEFNLRMEVAENEFLFFTKDAPRQELLLTERASLEISLNNKSQYKYYVRQQEPTFVIHHREDVLQFPFFIVLEQDLGLSEYQINEEALQHNHSFQYSQDPRRSMVEHDDIEGGSDGDHLVNIANILNQRDMNAREDYCFEKSELALELDKERRLSRNPGHRRYNNSNKKDPYSYEDPLSSSRFFLNRVSSKPSSFQEHH